MVRHSSMISERTLFVVCMVFVGAFSGENRKIGKKSDDEAKAEDICLLPSSSGICMAYFQMWFYNAKTKKCEMFIYGGCEGNGNRFESKSECENKCSKASITRRSSPKGPCAAELDKVNQEMIGSYIPQCDEDGYYKHKQCWGSVGSCWCVDRMGNKISSVEERPGSNVKLDCEYPCFKAYQKALKAPVLLRGVPIPLPLNQYVFLPSCDKEGYYLPKQCHTATGKCWCVDRLGTKLPGTETSTNTDKLQCN